MKDSMSVVYHTHGIFLMMKTASLPTLDLPPPLVHSWHYSVSCNGITILTYSPIFCHDFVATSICFIICLIVVRNAYAGGQEGQQPPLTSSMGGQEEQELPFKMNSFHISYFLKGHFPALLTVGSRKFFWGQPPDPQITIVVLRDQYIKHHSSGKEFNLPLWRNIYIYIYT